MSTEQQAEDTVVKLTSPNKYNVIMINDNVTPMDFVIQILMVIFHKDADSAKDVMLEVHEKGRSIAGTYSFEVAEQKSIETISHAQKAGYPLDVSIEENG